ncbi:MAG: hypothetical protein ACK55Z_12680, partial [bacterium]
PHTVGVALIIRHLGDKAHNPRQTDSSYPLPVAFSFSSCQPYDSFYSVERDTQFSCLPVILLQSLTRISRIGFQETFFLHSAARKVINTTSGGVSMYCTAGYCQRRHLQS